MRVLLFIFVSFLAISLAKIILEDDDLVPRIIVFKKKAPYVKKVSQFCLNQCSEQLNQEYAFLEVKRAVKIILELKVKVVAYFYGTLKTDKSKRILFRGKYQGIFSSPKGRKCKCKILEQNETTTVGSITSASTEATTTSSELPTIRVETTTTASTSPPTTVTTTERVTTLTIQTTRRTILQKVKDKVKNVFSRIKKIFGK
ncbi:Hypothetical protein SRAE_2000436000 [Strongyloides ratti]|uniref:Uncharacterized protein n=1 Tax=Strongyloides ratti TaxID=34506 RepID=A0A090LJ38_STRRB|nr:Hypothetical protein SRAE_2000436000 [Strongyloides ratti]CEF69713.2 Hypothetical protein SRAE_2000436000 [Strongyloides ratti]